MRIARFSVEVTTLPMSRVNRALRCYVDQVGLTLNVDYSPNDAFRVVQWTPRGSSCSIQIRNGLTDAPGFDPARGDYASFSDPGGNGWVPHERGYRNA